MTSQNLARNPDAPKGCLTLQQAERFYYIWRRVLRYVNERKQMAAPFAITDAGLERMSGEQAVAIRDVLWAEDGLLDDYARDNPDGLAQADLDLAALILSNMQCCRWP